LNFCPWRRGLIVAPSRRGQTEILFLKPDASAERNVIEQSFSFLASDKEKYFMTKNIFPA